jgi:UDP-N-acetylglucosamine 2-epimerase (non-hydrolysing)
MKLLHVVGARPNFMKVAPVWKAATQTGTFQQALVHTGQHYDLNMSEVFFADLGLPAPHYYLGVGSGSHAQQTAAVMVAFERVVVEMQPDVVLVYGDVNSTMAATLVCSKLLVPVAHVEAGLRSGDRTMPEEINRLVTDQVADLLFTPSADADANLLREGLAPEKIHRVGNVMIDSLVRLLPLAHKTGVLDRLGVEPGEYAVLTLHRPSNVDKSERLRQLLRMFAQLSERLPIIFPVHPRTKLRIAGLQPEAALGDVRIIDPLGYMDFLHLMSRARIVLTDSGGIQEETSYLGIPCLTLRANTERPVTVENGTNTLVGTRLETIPPLYHAVLDGRYAWDRRPNAGIDLWDGQAAQRIVAVLAQAGRDGILSATKSGDLISKEVAR